MQFVYPEFLFALFALSIPIIIHLFNFRKFKKVLFTNVGFLQEIKKDTQSRSRLKHLLVLLTRLLAIAALVFAFAKPFFPGEAKLNSTSALAVSIFIDNSFSMETVGKNGKLLDDAKRKAKEIVNANPPSTSFQLLTTDFEARHQRLVTKEQMDLLIDEIKPGSSSRMLSEIIGRQMDLLNTTGKNTEKVLYVLSDFQKSMCDLKYSKQDTLVNTYLVPFGAAMNNNLFIDSCWFVSPILQKSSSLEIVARIKNLSADAIENVPCKLYLNGKQKGLASVSLSSGESIDLKIPFSVSDSGVQHGTVTITDYPVTFDDTWYFTFETGKKISVLTINGETENKYLNALFSRDSVFSYQSSLMRQIDFSSFAAQNVILLSGLPTLSSGTTQELKKFLDGGGSAVLIPNEKSDITSYNAFLASLGVGSFSSMTEKELKINKLNTSSDFLHDVFIKMPDNPDLPAITHYFPFTTQAKSSSESLMNLENGSPFMLRVALGKGYLYIFTTPFDPEYSSFPKHALFVPILYRLAFLSTQGTAQSYLIGRESDIETNLMPKNTESAMHLQKIDSQFDIIPETRTVNGKLVLLVHDMIHEAGNYRTTNTEGYAGISFNYDRLESSLECLTTSEINNLADEKGFKMLDAKSAQFSSSLLEGAKGKQLWKYFILSALAFLLIEAVILRIMR